MGATFATPFGVASGGGAFILGIAQNIFGGALVTLAAAEGERDTYGTNNPAWLAYYDANPDKSIRLDYYDSGLGRSFVVYQTRSNGAWYDNSSAVGVKGDAGDKTDFSAIPPNHVVAIDEFGIPIDSQMELVGRDLVTPGSLQTGPSSILLGPNFRLSNGIYTVSYKLADGSDALGVNTPYSADGTVGPFFFKLGARSNLEINTQQDQTVASPFSLAYTTFDNNLTYDFMFVPKTAGDLRVRFWLGTDANGDLIFDEIRTVTQAEVDGGLPIEFGVGNKYILPVGTQIYVVMEGVDLAGGVVPSGPFSGQTLPYFVSKVQPFERVPLAMSGFVDYNNSGANQVLTSNVWNTILNNGLGPNTNKDYKPHGVTEMLDPVTGKLDFSGLDIGDQVTIRHTLNLIPVANGSTFQLRHRIGLPGFEYDLPVNIPAKMEQGGGQPTGNFTIESTIYIGDDNTKNGGAFPQLLVNGACTLDYDGVFISVIKRGSLPT